MQRTSDYLKITDQIYQIGQFSSVHKSKLNNYLILTDGAKMLIDLPTLREAPRYLTCIEELIGFKHITHLIVSITTPETFKVIEIVKASGFIGTIITNDYFSLFLKDTGCKIQTIESLKFKLLIDQQTTLKFIPVRFLPFPEMFFIYLNQQQALFSSTLFSSYTVEEDTLEIQKLSMIQYHQVSYPSSEYMKNPLKEVKKCQPKFILPLYGKSIIGKNIDALYETLTKLEFYNTYHVIKGIVDHQIQYNYIEIINHMLTHLNQHYSSIDILDAFVGSAFTLSNQPIELKRSKFENQQMWHAFFEHIYAQKGITWLSILEPIVNKYVHNYGLEKPNIYHSLVLDLTIESKRLKEEKQTLEDNLENLNQRISETQDQMNRCPITGLYNQDLFKELLKKDFLETPKEGETKGFLLVHIDQLQKINLTYGKDTGDETIRNLKYIMEQSKKSDALLFKQKGPGIIIYENVTTHENVEKCALKIRNLVEDSNLFIEKITVSISMITYDELDLNLDVEARIDQLLQLLDRGINTAKQKGSGEIIQKGHVPKMITEGIILLVDEDEINRNMIYRIFKRVNYEVIIAKDVHDALTLIEKHPIDIIISEINLSKIDGFSLKQMFNESMDYKKIPFIMVSHSKTIDNIKRGNTLDVDLILEKPIIPEELIGHVKRFRDRMRKE